MTTLSTVQAPNRRHTPGRGAPCARRRPGGLPAGMALAGRTDPAQAQYWASLPMDRYMQSAFSTSWSTASRLRAVSRSMTSSGG